MDGNFTFPQPQAPVPRPKPSSSTAHNATSRESSALRASVLDVALELGIANNSVVANWMFSNTLQEEEEEEEEQVSSPGLTQGSSTTSEESSSSRYPSTPSDSNHSPYFPILPSSGRPVAGWNPSKISTDIVIPYLPNAVPAKPIIFPVSSQTPVPIPPRPVTPTSSKKLRKKARNGDGYESDGGYISEGGKRREPKQDKKANGDLEEKNLKARAKEEKKEKEEERKRKKSLISAAKASKNPSDKDPFAAAAGYETDGTPATSSKSPFKSKPKKPKSSADSGGYETDFSNPNLKKSKTRFFKLGSKSSRPNLREDAQPVPTLEKEVMPLPIAERFATSLGALTSPSADLKISSPPSSSSPPSVTSLVAERPVNSQSQLQQKAGRLPTITTQPLNFEVTTITSSSSSSHKDRSSHSSAESSSSNGSGQKRQGVQFSPSLEGHGLGFGSIDSYSTITSASASASHSSHFHTPVSAPIPPPVIQSQIPLSPSYSLSPSGPLKPPLISLPITRSASPMSFVSPVAPLHINKSPTLMLPQLQRNSRAPSPSPLSPHSPYVMVTPTTSNMPPAASASPNPSTVPISPRPRNPPTEGFGPRPTFILPRTANESLSPPPVQTGRFSPHLTIVPSSHFIVPSPNASPLPSPSVLAYYDIPPPSPPPIGPLPNVPHDGHSPANVSAGAFPPSSHLRTKVLERQRSGNEMSMLSYQIQRGRESPFPSRPVVGANGNQNVGHVPGLEARIHVPRYRDLYGIGVPPPSQDKDQSGNGIPAALERKRQSPPKVDGNWVDLVDTRGKEEEEQHGEEEDMSDVIGRFAHPSFQNNDPAIPKDGHALESRRSSEAFREKRESFAVSDYYGVRDTIYSFEEGDKRNRESRWSGSIYSRMSILDPDKSEESRDRFVKRVEAMMEASREREKTIPPVPRIPDGLAGANSWNKF